jgi:predicted phage-related endonuclease
VPGEGPGHPVDGGHPRWRRGGHRGVFEAKFMLPWSFSEEFAAEKYMAQLQHNMWVTNARMAALSIITGGGKWVEISIAADQLYQHLLLTAEKKFWRCVTFGDPASMPPPPNRSSPVSVR